MIAELTIPMPWGTMSGQIFGDSKNPMNQPIVALHGHLDNSNSFKPLATILANHGYYVIAFDYPGHGLSSHFPKGMIYTPKNYLICIRRAIKYLKLNKKFIILSHSYGVVLSYMYETIFPNEARAIVAIDWVFALDRKKLQSSHLSVALSKGIDSYLEYEQEIEIENLKERVPLTFENAVQRLLQANSQLDTDAAKLLLERGLIKKNDERLEFSRDIYAKKAILCRDHYSDFIILLPDILEYMKAPILLLIAWPSSFGESVYEKTMSIIDDINKNGKSTIEAVQVEGTHHFHMIKPKETADVILEFLKRKLDTTGSQENSKL